MCASLGTCCRLVDFCYLAQTERPITFDACDWGVHDLCLVLPVLTFEKSACLQGGPLLYPPFATPIPLCLCAPVWLDGDAGSSSLECHVVLTGGLGRGLSASGKTYAWVNRFTTGRCKLLQLGLPGTSTTCREANIISARTLASIWSCCADSL